MKYCESINRHNSLMPWRVLLPYAVKSLSLTHLTTNHCLAAIVEADLPAQRISHLPIDAPES